MTRSPVPWVPKTHPDLFDSKKPGLDLTSAAGVDFNLVDGTVAIATEPQSPFILFKGQNQNTWFFAPRWGRLGRAPDGKPAVTLVRKVRRNPDGTKTTLGGALSFMFELAYDLPSSEVIAGGVSKLEPRPQWRRGA